MMESRILYRVEFDPVLLQSDVDKILKSPPASEDYSEYRFGIFHTYILRSPEGSEHEGLFRGLRGKTRNTPLGNSLAYINETIDQIFDTDRLRMMRAYLLQDAVLIPHRDYVEFKEDARRMVRLHLPVVTNPQALHSDGDIVFHMRVGEVWYLNVSEIHAACNASDAPRLSLVLDFVVDGLPLESVFRIKPRAPLPEPEIIHRPPLDPEFDKQIESLGSFLSDESFRDVAQLLSRIHFYRQAPAGLFFEWLRRACAVTGRPELIDKAEQFNKFLVTSREIGERFIL